MIDNSGENMKNKKGFTMVELLVAMAIMGLLIIMAFPTIRAVQTNNQNTKFREYGSAAISATKLYADSYSEDLFDSNITNQFKPVEFKELVKKDLLKEISVSGAVCIPESTVTVVKYGDDYSYCLHLKCTDKTGNKTLYEEKNRRGNCSKFKPVTLTYKVTIGEDLYTTTRTIIGGESNIKTLTEGDLSGFPIASNHLVIDEWESSIGNYKPGSYINKPIEDNVTFNASLKPFKYTVKYASGLNGATGSISQHDCWYGQSCVTTSNAFKKDYYSFDHWSYNDLTIKNNADLNDFVMSNKISITNNMIITLSGTFKKNQVFVTYNANGGSLASQHAATITLNGNKILVGGKEIHHTLNFDDSLTKNGLIDWNNKNYLNLIRSKYNIKAKQEWKATSGGSTGVFDQSVVYTGTQLCPNVKNGNCTVNMNANWVAAPTYTCAAGKYLPSNSTTCATCLNNYYCPGGTYDKKSSNQGIIKCPAQYPSSNAGSSKINNCYKTVKASFDYNISKYQNLNNIRNVSQTNSLSCNAYYNSSCKIKLPTPNFGREEHHTRYNGHNYTNKYLNRYFTCVWKNNTLGSFNPNNEVSISSNTSFKLNSCTASSRNITIISNSANVKIRWYKDDVYNKGVVASTFKGFANDEAKLGWTGSWMIDKTTNNNCVWFYGTVSPRSKSHKCSGNHGATTCSSTVQTLTGWLCGNLTTN